jgi:hypothetical protein
MIAFQEPMWLRKKLAKKQTLLSASEEFGRAE